MYAVFSHGPRQYRAKQGDVITIDYTAGSEPGSRIEFDRVLAHNGNLGAPALDGIKVVGEIVEHFRGKKIYVQKFRRRKNYRRLKGHRQDYTRVRITEILGGGSEGPGPVPPGEPASPAITEPATVAAGPIPAPLVPTAVDEQPSPTIIEPTAGPAPETPSLEGSTPAEEPPRPPAAEPAAPGPATPAGGETPVAEAPAAGEHPATERSPWPDTNASLSTAEEVTDVPTARTAEQPVDPERDQSAPSTNP